MSYGPEIWIGRDPEELAQESVRRMIDFIKKTISSTGKFSLVLSGGKTPEHIYRMLASHREIDWKKVDFFFGDERMVPYTNSESNFLLAQKNLLEPLHIQSENIHPIPVTSSPLEAAKAYENELKSYFEKQKRSLDLVLLGLGSDGHTASLFPGDSLLLRKNDTALCVEVLNAPKIPTDRVTLTPYAINQARKIMVVVSGKEKAPAVCAALESDADPIEIPIRSIIPIYGQMIWLLDQAAAHALTQSSI